MGGSAKGGAESGGGGDGGVASKSGYSESTCRSMANIDEARINYDLIEAAVATCLERMGSEGEDALLRGWEGYEVRGRERDGGCVDG